MKKKNIALIVSALVFAATTALVGCSSKPEQSASSAESSGTSAAEEQHETQPDPLAPTAPPQESSTKPESGESSSAETATEPVSTSSATESVTGENGTVSPDASDAELIAAAQTLFDSACKTNWNFHVGCPYDLDYNSYVENDFGWQFYLVTDEKITSLADVEEDYNKIFSSSYENDLSEIYLESDGRVYALAGERGANVFYTGSRVTEIRKRTDKELFFTVENYYSGDDFNPETSVTETADFSAVIAEDGSWHAGQFTLPY